MKNLQLILSALFFLGYPLIGNAQDLGVGNNFVFKSNLLGYSSKVLEMADGSSLPAGAEVVKNHRVKIVKKESGKVLFTYFNFNNDPVLEAIYKGKVFAINEADFEELTQPLFDKFRGFKYGTYTIPIRIRSLDTTNYEFNSNLSLGANLIGRFGINRKSEFSYLDISAGIGLTKVDLNGDNSLLGEPGKFGDIKVLSPIAITFTLGALFNLAQDVNFGVYLGWDRISSSDNMAGWIYNGRLWTGIGLNVTFSAGGNQSNERGDDERTPSTIILQSL